MEEQLLNKILTEIITIKENQNKMSLQISDLSIGQNKLNNKIEDVKTELKQEIQDVRTELKQEIQDVKTELKQEVQDVRTELKSLRELAEFTKDTCEVIMKVCQNEFKKEENRFKVLKLMNEDNREKCQNHEYRICKIEMKLKCK